MSASSPEKGRTDEFQWSVFGPFGEIFRGTDEEYARSVAKKMGYRLFRRLIVPWEPIFQENVEDQP